MRSLLLALCGALALTAHADDNWQAFPLDQSAYDFSGDKLKQQWPTLTRGFHYPFPDAAKVREMATRYPELREQTAFTGDAEAYSQALQDVWRSMFRGDYAKAKADGLKLGPAGQVPAMFAQVTYALYLEPNPARKHALLEEVIERTDAAGALVQADTLAQFGRAYAKARLGEELPIGTVLKRGYTSQIPNELEALLKQDPQHAFALATLGGYHAGVIRKVGSMMARMTYGANKGDMEKYFARSMSVVEDIPISHVEYANALVYVYDDDEAAKALAHLRRAAALKPTYAMEALEVELAKKLLQQQEQQVAAR
ncbi:hypothetical protein [Atopomonas sediminilitoris]|uniref:hypothetical protein n=1 Tax=Atopomonas sediminilitoris TaxID=2919919 RepID=UPI001F4ED080|nr:hypothetical protein [Atopomonas sediminilitoris]MCJ8170105.1 hypothetical protein [Atopomonas sediminilitoris]